MRKLLFAVVGFGLVAVGCVRQPQVINAPPTSQYDNEKAAMFMAEGPNTIRGNAFLKTRGGEVRTCAGNPVLLLPDVQYNRSVLQQSHPSGSRSARQPSVDLGAATSVFTQYGRKTTCDSNGEFIFDNVAEGDFIILSRVVWEVPGSGYQGGEMVDYVSTRNKSNQKVIITRY